MIDDKLILEAQKLSEENDLLRGIVLRQQKEQARRDRVKKLVLEQLAKLEIHVIHVATKRESQEREGESRREKRKRKF